MARVNTDKKKDHANVGRAALAFTPGPWAVAGAAHVFSPSARANVASVSDPYAGQYEAHYQALRIDSDHFDEACANARLIAAAPTLLDAALAIRDTWNEYDGSKEGMSRFVACMADVMPDVLAAIALSQGVVSPPRWDEQCKWTDGEEAFTGPHQWDDQSGKCATLRHVSQ